MTKLLLRTTDLLLRRLTHTADHPRWRAPIYLGLLAAGIVASGWLAIRNYQDMLELEPAARSFAVVIAVAIGYVIAGPVVLTAELARDRSGRFRAALAPLPLTRRSVHLLAWGPVLLLIALLLVLLLPPTFATLLGAGLAPFDAALYACLSLILGAGSAALAVLVVSILLAGEKWGIVRAPLCYLSWAALSVVQLLVSVDALLGHEAPARHWLLLPDLVEQASRGARPAPVTAIAIVAVGAAVAAGLLFGVGDRVGAVSHGRILLPWPGRLARHRVAGELRYALRDASTLTNLTSGLRLPPVGLCLVLQLPEAARDQAVPLAMTVILLTAGIPARGLRGIFPSRLTVQQTIGMTAGSWVAGQLGVGVVLFVVAGVPATLLPGLVWPQDAVRLLALGLAVLACSTAFGWAVVVRNDNPLGQVLVTLAYLAAGSAVTGLVLETTARLPPLGIALAVTLWIAGSAVSFAMERARWRYRAA
jgi:hypothetical protein